MITHEGGKIRLAMVRTKHDTKVGWVPTAEQSAVLDWLAMGYSQQAVSRLTEVPQQTIWGWVNDLSFSGQFREEIARRNKLFTDNLERIEDQQILQASAVVSKAVQGEYRRDATGQRPIELDVAMELLRNTRWKQRAGGHKKFGRD